MTSQKGVTFKIQVNIQIYGLILNSSVLSIIKQKFGVTLETHFPVQVTRS